MIQTSLTASDRRALVAGTTAIATMIMFGLGLPTFRTWRAATMESANHESAELARAQRRIALHGQTDAALTHLRGQLTGIDSTLLSGVTAASAGTALAEAISEAAEGTGAELGSIQIRADTVGASRLIRVGARANVSGDIESLVLFLESIEAGPPTLAIREWSISGGSPKLASGQREVLRLDLVVEGLSRRTASGQTR